MTNQINANIDAHAARIRKELRQKAITAKCMITRRYHKLLADLPTNRGMNDEHSRPRCK